MTPSRKKERGSRPEVAQGPYHASESDLALWNRLKIHIHWFASTQVDASWGSQGREESDYLHHINFVAAGEATVIHKGNRLPMKCGHAYLAPGNTPMRRLAPTFMDTFWVTFRCEFVEGMDPLLDYPDRRPVDLGEWGGDGRLGRWQGGRISLADGLWLRCRILDALAAHFPRLEEIVAAQLRRAGRFNAVLKAMDECLGADLRIENLAKIHGLSPQAFSMAFTREMGLNPKAFMNRKLHEKACHLLVQTDQSIKQIAHRLGFGDEYYFSRFFKRMSGGAPSHYRNLRRGARRSWMDIYNGAGGGLA